jgi:hypothetical protein
LNRGDGGSSPVWVPRGQGKKGLTGGALPCEDLGAEKKEKKEKEKGKGLRGRLR